ncbi:acetyl-CoA acetyltransferase [Mycolicibacterium porcinum]|uniref:Acetyl-CoA acetyltransferase n=1 Tax=Mycolicibacterium porcinum TaxID=39693 RepID=A0AAW5T044_9MYCO|nr:acetyl-CoA acetyltransferase [Mycolicibacterium porcinum]MCV7388047.1 acetyl-CoA acetyltransferase [Mycolicibacterium porcinum]ORB43424.1 acetyl-CoA acetyltransferase [Mycolicibacterium porcinum]CDO31267.1 thiolase [Mycolicibacterium vulneris]
MNRGVAVAGVALSDVGRVDDKSPYELIAQASRRALADAGLTPADVDGLASTGQGTLPPVDVGEYLGLRPRWIDSTAVGGAAWEVMAAHAADAIAAGHADVVLLTYGSTARADLRKGLRGANINWGARGPLQWEAPYGHTLVSKYAMAARRHMHTYGTTIEQLAEVAVSARFNAADNPDAYYREPITVDDVLDGPMIADPFTKLHCCIRSDGGAAAVLVSADRAKDLKNKPVWVLGTGETTSHMLTSQWDDLTVGPAAVSGPLAFARAGVSPADVDVAELYDAFTYMLLLTLEDLGFCPKGEGGAFVQTGALRLGGALPTNTDGGGLSACHPGQRGLFLLVEATRQLRGECGPRQVSDAKIACVSGTGGWFCSSGTVILGAEEP